MVKPDGANRKLLEVFSVAVCRAVDNSYGDRGVYSLEFCDFCECCDIGFEVGSIDNN